MMSEATLLPGIYHMNTHNLTKPLKILFTLGRRPCDYSEVLLSVNETIKIKIPLTNVAGGR